MYESMWYFTSHLSCLMCSGASMVLKLEWGCPIVFKVVHVLKQHKPTNLSTCQRQRICFKPSPYTLLAAEQKTSSENEIHTWSTHANTHTSIPSACTHTIISHKNGNICCRRPVLDSRKEELNYLNGFWVGDAPCSWLTCKEIYLLGNSLCNRHFPQFFHTFPKFIRYNACYHLEFIRICAMRWIHAQDSASKLFEQFLLPFALNCQHKCGNRNCSVIRTFGVLWFVD